MSGKLPDVLPDGDYVIYSLIDGPLGIGSIMGAMDRVPVIVPSPGFYPQKFGVKLVDESKRSYVITVDGKNHCGNEIFRGGIIRGSKLE